MGEGEGGREGKKEGGTEGEGSREMVLIRVCLFLLQSLVLM